MNGNMPAFTPQLVFDMWNCKSFPMEREFQQIAMRQYASGSNDSTNSNPRYRDASNNRSRNNFNEYESEDEQQAYSHYDGDYGFAERKNVPNAAVYSADAGSYSTNGRNPSLNSYLPEPSLASLQSLQPAAGPFGQFSTTMSNGYSNFQTDQTLAEKINSAAATAQTQTPQSLAVQNQPAQTQPQQAAPLNPGFNSSLMAYYLNSANVDGNLSALNSKPSSQTKPSSQMSQPQSNEGEPVQPPVVPKESREDSDHKQQQEPAAPEQQQQQKNQTAPQDADKDGYPDYPSAQNSAAFHPKQQAYPAQPVQLSRPPQFVHSHRYQHEDAYQHSPRWSREQQASEEQQRFRVQDNKQPRYPSQDNSQGRAGYYRGYQASDGYGEYAPQQPRYQPKPQYEHFSQTQNSFHLRGQAGPQFAGRHEGGGYGQHSGGYSTNYHPTNSYNPYLRPSEDGYKYRR